MDEIINIKSSIIDIGKKAYDKSLTTGMSGNISFRCNDKIFITASSSCLGELNETEILILNIDGNILDESETKPSSESMMHIEIYKKRPEINSIIHAHPPFSTALAAVEEKVYIPLLAEPIVILGDVPVVKYKTPSTIELAKEVAEAFENCDAAFMSNHGVVVCGKSLKETFYKLETLEFYSRVFILSGTIGKRAELSPENVQDLMKLRALL